jgi:PAS domain S-box-containing protein
MVLIGGVIAIGAVLQLAVFPLLKGDSAVIRHIKIIHLVASAVVILICWLSIELISKKITLPLKELTQRADQISRDAGKGSVAAETKTGRPPRINDPDPMGDRDEIVRLKLSFYRMLAHLKASELRLRKSEEKYKFLFDNGPNPLFVIDSRRLSILDVNNRAMEAYGYTRNEFLNMRFQDLAAENDKSAVQATLNRLMTSEIFETRAFRHFRKDGSSFLSYLQPHVSWLEDRPAIILAVWDVTEKLEQEAKMAQTAKMATLGEMATGIAHELNQPLNVIGLASDFLKKSLNREEGPGKQDLEYISTELISNVRRASIIINHLREFGHSAQDEMAPVDINKPVNGVKTLLGTQLEKKGIGLEIDLQENMPHIMGNENRLEQVLINLALNAKDAMLGQSTDRGTSNSGKRHTLTIKTRVEKDLAEVIVEDNGPGTPDSIKHKIFDPFFTTKKVGEGTGIGLSISYGIIKEHGGAIEVRDREGGGAQFRLSFPLIEPQREGAHG